MSLGTAVIAIVAWSVLEFGGVDIPAHVALAGAFIINFFIGWATKPSGRRANV